MDNSSLVTVLLASLGVFLIIALVYYILLIIGGWKVNEKAGEAGWKSIIPIYNTYILFKIAWKKTSLWWVWFLCPLIGAYCNSMASNNGSALLNVISTVLYIIAFVLSCMQASRLSKSFGYGTGFTIGLLFLNPIFIMILGLGSAQYQGPQE